MKNRLKLKIKMLFRRSNFENLCFKKAIFEAVPQKADFKKKMESYKSKLIQKNFKTEYKNG